MSRPFAEATFAFAGARVIPRRFHLTREAHRHEVAVVRVYDHPASRFETGSPVTVAWGEYPRSREEFAGYIHHAQPVYDRNDDRYRRQVVDVVCIGMTGPLTEPRSMSWLNTRTDMLVAEAANAVRLHHRTDDGHRVLSDLVQGAESTWKFLVKRAKEDGMVLFAQGATIHLHDRSRVLRDYRDTAQVIRHGAEVSFTGTVGELNTSDREAVEREVFGVSDQGLFAYSDRKRTSDRTRRPQPAMTQILTGVAVEGAGGLEKAVEAARREESFTHEATLVLPGVEHLMVCSPVILDSFGQRYDGLWSVNRVKFGLDEGETTTELTLLRSPGERWRSPARRGERPTVTYGEKRRERVRLIDDRWVAA